MSLEKIAKFLGHSSLESTQIYTHIIKKIQMNMNDNSITQSPPSGNLGGYLQSKGYSKSTIKCYHTEMLEFIVWCDKENIESENTTGTEVTGYLKHLQNKGQNNKTRNVNLNILKHYFNYLISIEAREDNPARQIKIRGTVHKQLNTIFTKQELENIYHNYKTLEETDERSNRNWFKKSLVSKKRNKVILSLMI
ncbi:MAG: phage integrase N-terminal SAM-like domain-containing protein [Ferruginibacter sp.]